jgi:hypothetical protein
MSLGFTKWAILLLLYTMNYYIKVFYYRFVEDSKLKKFAIRQTKHLVLGTNSYMFRRMRVPLVFERK